MKDFIFERPDLEEEPRALTLISYVTTLTLTRSLLFYYKNIRSKSLQVVIYGTHLHHFIFGILLLVTAGIIYWVTRKRKTWFSAILVGTGLGLLFDETTLWLPFKLGGYWSIDNFLISAGVGIILFFRVFPLKEHKILAQSELNYITQAHENTSNPYISVVVPTFNEEKFVARTLQSLVAQTFKDFELIVVDNNSSDHTAEIARSFGATVIKEPRQGVGHARQRGFMAAKGGIIATTDADTVVPPDWLLKIAWEFKNNQNLVAFGGLYTLYSGPIFAKIAIAYLSHPLFKVDKFFCGGWSLPGANLAVRKQSFLQVGGFNTEIKLCEDVDISQRLRKVGQVELDPNFLVRTSGRRYKHGFLLGLMTYAPNAIVRMLLKKHKFGRLTTVRTNASFLHKFSFMLPLCLLIFLFSLFYLSNPLISQYKVVTTIRHNTGIVAERIKTELKEFTDHLH